MRLGRKFVLIALFLWCLQPAQADAGCGCQKPPPPISNIRPSFASPGDEVVLFAPGFEVGATYMVTFHSSVRVSLWARAKLRRDLADGVHKPQIIVEMPNLPPGPTSVTVSRGWSVVLEVAEHEFTALQKPIVLPEANRDTVVTCYQAAVGSDSTVYVPVDVSAIAERMIFTGRGEGYRLMFGSEDIAIYNTQGVLMQLLGPNVGEIYAIYHEEQGSSFTLAYDRHEFVTYRNEHAHEDGYGLDPTDSEWHTDGTRHIDHDHLVIAIRGLVNGEDLPVPGQTPRFTFHLSTWLGDEADGGDPQPTLVQDHCDGNAGSASRRGPMGGRGRDHDDDDEDKEEDHDDDGDKDSDPGNSGSPSGEGGSDEDGDDGSGSDGAGNGSGSDGAGNGSGSDGGDDAAGAGDPDPGVGEGDDGEEGDSQPSGILCGAMPRTGCRITVKPGRAQLLIKDRTPNSRDMLVWKWVNGEGTEMSDFGSVMTTDSIALCMYDESDESPALVFAATVPGGNACSSDSPGEACWRGLGKRQGSYRQYAYQNGTRTPDGIERVVLKPGDAGSARLSVMGRGENLDLSVMPVSSALRVQLQAETGSCWEATYFETGEVQGDAQQFSGRAE